MELLSLKLMLSLSVLLILVLASCNNTTQTIASAPVPQNPEFIARFKKCKQTTLPIVIRACDFQNGFPLTNSDSMSAIDSSGMVPYCSFKTNGNYIILVMLGPADCTLPYLITYDSTGKIISEASPGIGQCGLDVGFHCSEYMIIKSDFSIYTSDTISQADVDSLSNEIPATVNKYVLYKKGKLQSNGTIELSDIIRQKLNN